MIRLNICMYDEISQCRWLFQLFHCSQTSCDDELKDVTTVKLLFPWHRKRNSNWYLRSNEYRKLRYYGVSVGTLLTIRQTVHDWCIPGVGLYSALLYV